MTTFLTYNHPLPISDEEWAELAAHPVVRNNWYLSETDDADSLAAVLYGVKFDYQPEANPMLRADLYVLISHLSMDDAEHPVIFLCRDRGNGGELEPLVLPMSKSALASTPLTRPRGRGSFPS